jgi:hypothetical protein
LKDEKLAYPLTNNGGVVNENGLFGLDNAWRFNGSNYLTQATLLDTTPDKGIVIDCFIKADNGRPSSTVIPFAKINTDGTQLIQLYLNSNGQLQWYINVSGGKTVFSQTIFPSGGTPYYYLVCAWDLIYGLRLWVNGMLEGQDSTATTLMSSGTARDFIIGANNNNGTLGNYFSGMIANFRVRNKIITQADVDLGYATRYPNTNQYKNTILNCRPNGDKVFEFVDTCPVVATDANYIYRKGFTPGYGLKGGDIVKVGGV